MKRPVMFVFRYLISVAANIWISLLGLMPRYREVCYEAAYRLGWRCRPVVLSSLPPLDIPSATLSSLIPRPHPVTILEPEAADGNVTEWELVVLAQITASFQPAACFEIGTFDGRTALNLAANMPPDGHVYTLDLPSAELKKTSLKIAPGDEHFIVKEESGVRFKGTEYAARITQLWGDSAAFDYSPYLGRMDLVFVDGAHSADYVKKDTQTALRLLKPAGGVILWHDYSSLYWKGLTCALNELRKDIPGLATMQHIKNTTLVVWRA